MDRTDSRPALLNRVRERRARRGMSQEELARCAGVTRQTVSGIEAGHFVPSTLIALRLARALGCAVEDLFDLPDPGEILEVELAADGAAAGGAEAQQPIRVVVGRLRRRWVAHPLVDAAAVDLRLPCADGLAEPAGAGRVRVCLLDEAERLASTVLVAGCDPSLGLVAARLGRGGDRPRAVWFNRSSTRSLAALARGEVHVAGTHLRDDASAEFNVPFVVRMLPGRRCVVINLAYWEEGLLVARGNPLGIRGCDDLARPGVRLINREPGSGARRLLDRELARGGIEPRLVRGYERQAASHLDVARAIACGEADVGVGPGAVARLLGVDFVPLERERYDLVVPEEYMSEPAVQAFLNALSAGAVRRELRSLGGYDDSDTCKVIAEVAP